MKFKFPKNPDLGILLVRLGLGLVFVFHGLIKIQNASGTSAFFKSLGLPLFVAYLVIAIELFGGIALIAGIMTRWAGWLLAFDMIGAIFLVKLHQGWPGLEFELLLLLSAISVTLTGPGAYIVKKQHTK